jgi:acetyltransferase-like isoleucine patch superfamily enzyme
MRGLLYKFTRQTKIGNNFRIGFGSYIDSYSILIGDNVSIGNMVRIKFLDKFYLGNNSSIGSSTVICGAYNEKKVAERIFKCGNYVSILCSHYFDVVSPITIGDNVTVAGKWTQIYTHSFDLHGNRLDGAVTIADNVYIGAGCLINLGVNICGKVVLSGGTCVNKSIEESGVYTSNTFMKRGEVRDYADLYQYKQTYKMNDDGTVYTFDS